MTGTDRGPDMNPRDKTIVVTGGASGIGKALCERFAREGAKVIVTDLSQEKADAVAAAIGGTAMICDVTKESDIQNLVSQTEAELGPIDMFVSNAGLGFGEPGHAASASNDIWQTCWDVHVMAHVYAARAVLPGMIERNSGYLLNMASAAGLLNQIGDAAYSATKHAAVGFAEALAITHKDDGIGVSVICPQYVATPLLGYKEDNVAERSEGTITPREVAECVMEGLAEERFLILPHPEVETFIRHKTGDYDRWLSGMRKLRRGIIEKTGSTRAEDVHKLI